MNGKKVKVGQFASSLRKKLFQEHLGLLNQPVGNVLDPISDHFYNVIFLQLVVMLHALLIINSSCSRLESSRYAASVS